MGVLITQMHWEQEYQLLNALQDEYGPIILTRSEMSKGKKTTILESFSAQLELSKIRLYHSIEVLELCLERWLGALECTRRRIWAGFTNWVVDVPWDKYSILRIFWWKLELSKIGLYHSIEVIELYLERWLGALERTRRRIWAGFT